jgi:predicted transcriptional regulator
VTALREILDSLSVRLYGRTLGEAQRGLICIRCAKPVRPDEMPTEDATEYMLSGFCPKCFESVMPDE